MRQFLLFLIIVITLTGCVSPPPQPKHAIDLPAQLERLAAINQWRLNGKIAIKTPEESVSASVTWRSNDADSEFVLTNFLGVKLLDLAVTKRGTTLHADDKSFVAATPEQAIWQASGWHLPYSALQSWVKGVPLINDAYQLNDVGLVTTLAPQCYNCDVWQVDFQRYQQVDDYWLPYLIVLTKPSDNGTSIKLRINQWHLQ